MAVTWEEADEELIGLAQRIIRENHPHLLDAHIGFMYRSEAAKSGMKMILGQARKVSDKDQVFIHFDFIIWVAQREFKGLSADQQEALVDHELCHCGGQYGAWKMRHHDVQEFNCIIVRHGLWMADLAFAAKAFENAGKGQQALFYAEERGGVASVPGNLLERAREDPDAVAAELYRAAEALKAENGGEITISLLQRTLRIGYTKAAKIKGLLDQVNP